MKKVLILLSLVFGLSTKSFSQFCPSCVQNSAATQNAQFNISSATIRGPLTVGSIVGPNSFVVGSSMTAAIFFGSGTYLTQLNASQLLFGTVPSAAVSGNYPNITGIGTLTSGTWNGSILGSQYGGTNANLVTSGVGSIPYFSSVGTMSVLAPNTAGFLLQTNGSAAPSWTGAPQVLGTNITGIPMANLIPGQLPTTISINDASISTVSAAKVIGNIPGNANNIYGILSLLQLSTGTLVNTIVASSITATGVTPGIFGGPTQLPQITVAYDGRITAISQSSFTIAAGSITSGALPIGVTITPAQITAGSLGSSVIASSLNATGVVPGSYGFASQTSSITVGVDGRISFANDVPIAINTSQINNGTLTAGVVVPAANIQAGTLAGNVIASSVAATGIVAGTYGTPTNTIQVVVGADGRLSAVNQFLIPGASSGTVFNNIDNGWTATQTFFSSVTIHGNLSAQNFTANNVSGNGSGLTNLQPGSISSGTLSSSVVASSIAATGVTPGTYGDSSHVSQIVVGIDGRISSAANIGIPGISTNTALNNKDNGWLATQTYFSSITVNGNMGAQNLSLTYGINSTTGSFSGSVSVVSSVTAGAFFGDGSHLSGVAATCTNGSGNSSVNCSGSGNVSAGPFTVVSGGQNNSAGAGNNSYDTVSGGVNNTAGSVGSFVGGGSSNTASGTNSVVVGGSSNSAIGLNSFAAGWQANAISNGSFVWNSDSSGSTTPAHAVYDNGKNTFNVYATGGVWLSSGSVNVQYGVAATTGVFTSSATASAFFGDGSHLTGLLTTVCTSGSGGTSVACQGLANTATNSYSVVSGGLNNISSGANSFVGGGETNHATASHSTISGGQGNTASNLQAVVAGGQNNTASGSGSAVAGGLGDIASGNNSFVGGGNNNTANSLYSTIAGGISNTAGAQNASVPGGSNNNANGLNSFAGGFAANAVSDGSFVWNSDPNLVVTNADKVYDNGKNTFNVYAVGGIYFSSGSVNLQYGIHAATGVFTGVVTASTFNAIGSAYQMNGATIIDHVGNITASSGTFTGTLTASGGVVLTSGNINTGGGTITAGNVTSTGTVAAVTFTGDASQLVYANSMANAIPFITTSGSTLTFNASGLSFDPVNRRLGIRTANPIHGLDCSSCTLYLDGNSANPIQVGNNGSTMTLTSGGNLSVVTGFLGGLGSAANPTYAFTGGAGPVGTGMYYTSASGDNLDFAVGQAISLQLNSNVGYTKSFAPFWSTNGTASIPAYSFTSDPTSGMFYNTTGGANLRFSIGGLAKLSIDPNGNVGIGTIVPATLLDVNGSDTIRGQETVTSTVTIQGNAFSVGGSTLAVSGGSVGIDQAPESSYALAVNGAAEFTNYVDMESSATIEGNAFSVGGSSFTVGGGSTTVAYQLTAGSINLTGPNGNVTSQSSVTASAFFGDGSHLTGLTVSSCTIIPNTTFTNTAFGIAFATVTLTTRGFPVYLSVVDTVQGSGAPDIIACTMLVDSGFNSNAGSAALYSQRVPAANTDTSGQIASTQLTQASGANLTSGVHTFALTCSITANTGTILNNATHYAQLCVKENP